MFVLHTAEIKAKAHTMHPINAQISIENIRPIGPFLKIRLGPDFGLKSPDFDFVRKTGLFRTGLSPDSIPMKKPLVIFV